MKKSILLLTIGLIFSNVALSQNKIRIGVNTGVTLSSLRGGEVVNSWDSEIGFLAGISFEYYFKRNLSINVDLNFEGKNLSLPGLVNGEFGFTTVKFAQKLNYLTLPILMKYEFGKKNNFYVNGGAFIGFLLSAKNIPKGQPSYSIKSTLTNVDSGLSFGIGTKIHLGNKNDLGIEIRDNLGLVNIYDDGVNLDIVMKTNSYNLILSWDFEM